jgi:hypothetical protein
MDWLLPALHEVEPLYGLAVISPNWSVGYVIWIGGRQPHMKWKDCHMNWRSPISHELERLSYELVVASPSWIVGYTIWNWQSPTALRVVQSKLLGKSILTICHFFVFSFLFTFPSNHS